MKGRGGKTNADFSDKLALALEIRDSFVELDIGKALDTEVANISKRPFLPHHE